MKVSGTAAPSKFEDEDKAMAAEYVLGLLPPAQRSAFESVLLSDQDLQQDVAAWRQYFSTFAEDFKDRTPPPQLINRIESRLSVVPRTALWKQVLPYVIGAALGSVLTWIAVSSGVMPVH